MCACVCLSVCVCVCVRACVQACRRAGVRVGAIKVLSVFGQDSELSACEPGYMTIDCVSQAL